MLKSTVISKQHLIIFTRYPEPGKTKTRLIPALGTLGAANLHQQMTEHTIFQVKELQKAISVSVEVRFTGVICNLYKTGWGMAWFTTLKVKEI